MCDTNASGNLRVNGVFSTSTFYNPDGETYYVKSDGHATTPTASNLWGTRLTYSYGSGNYNRPLSRTCRFFIKY